MGAFYGNITLRGPSQENVARALRGRLAIVTPQVGEYTVAFDSVCDAQDVDAIQALSAQLSGEFQCSALAVIVHDDDILYYYLYQSGELSDWYNSCPSYFDLGTSGAPSGPAGGNAERLCAAFGMSNRDEVHRILHNVSEEDGYVFETERHSDLVRALKLPACAVGSALANFDRGEFPEGLSADQMLRAADPPTPKNPQRRMDQIFYEMLGPEDAARPCRRDGCNRGAIPLSVMCKRHHFEMIKGRDCPFDG